MKKVCSAQGERGDLSREESLSSLLITEWEDTVSEEREPVRFAPLSYRLKGNFRMRHSNEVVSNGESRSWLEASNRMAPKFNVCLGLGFGFSPASLVILKR